MGYSFFWKFIEDSFKNVYVELESLLFARPIYNNVQIKEKSPPFWIRNKKTHTHTHTHTHAHTHTHIYKYIYIYENFWRPSS